MTLPNAIKTKEEYQHFLNKLNEHYAKSKLSLKLNESEKIRFMAIVDLLEAFNSELLFEIRYTNNTAEVKSFSNYKEAFDASYSDHLWDVTPIKTGHKSRE